MFVPRSPAAPRVETDSARCQQPIEAHFDRQYAIRMAAPQRARHSLLRDGVVVPKEARLSLVLPPAGAQL